MNEFSPLFLCYFFFLSSIFLHLNQIIKRTFFCFYSKHVKAIKQHILLILNEFHVTNFFPHIILLCYLNLTLWWILLQLIQMRIFLFLPFYKNKKNVSFWRLMYINIQANTLHFIVKKRKERNTSDMNWISLLIHIYPCMVE